MIKALCAAAFLLQAAAALGQEISLGLGASSWQVEPRDRSYAWSIGYRHDLGERLFATFTYLNEGHVPGHHRDGEAVQLWARAPLRDRRLELAVGAGPYRYFDTALAEQSSLGTFRNAHGWAGVYSIAATWYSGRWLYRLQADRIEAPRAPDTTLVLASLGYRLEQDPSFGAAPPGRMARRREIVAMTGRTIVNSFESEHAFAKSVEYRHAFGRVVRASIGWIDEGDARLVRRNGAVAEAWLEPTFYGERLTMGIGGGGYVALDDYRVDGRRHRALGIVSLTASCALAPAWNARLLWHRIASNYDRDSDIVLLGLGYRF